MNLEVILTPEQYIEKFSMDYDPKNQFNHNDFLVAFAEEFYEKVRYCDNYHDFNGIVAGMMTKFKAIRHIRTKKHFISDKLWKAFFAIYVVPKRRELFPLEQSRLDQKHGKSQENY